MLNFDPKFNILIFIESQIHFFFSRPFLIVVSIKRSPSSFPSSSSSFPPRRQSMKTEVKSRISEADLPHLHSRLSNSSFRLSFFRRHWTINIIIIFTNVLSPPASSINTGVTQHSQVVATISNFTSHHQRHRHHRRNNYRNHHHNYHSQHYLMDQSNGLPLRHSSAHLKLIMMTGLLNII